MPSQPKKTKSRLEIAPAFEYALSIPSRYKVWYGGRGGAKSWSVARILLLKAYTQKLRILCTRELQVSISDSVHRLLSDQIISLGLADYFEVTKTSIKSHTGSEFIFKGLKHNVQEIKSLEGVNICWVEEAHRTSKESWNTLIPTIRAEHSEIWLTFNPDLETDETYQRFVISPPPGAIVKQVNFDDNPWFSDALFAEMEYCRRVDIDAYRNIWLGEPRGISDAVIMKGKYEVGCFEAPEDASFFYGADWGFSQDPTVLVRCYIADRTLYIDYEAWGIGIEIDKTPSLFDAVPLSRRWPIFADSARPETISAIRRAGFAISAAKKWPGSVEDGIAYLRQFEKIIIHERCIHTIQEMGLYSYKVDKNTDTVLPDVVDKNNHCIDAIRYALSEYIQRGIQVYDYQAVSRRVTVSRDNDLLSSRSGFSRGYL